MTHHSPLPHAHWLKYLTLSSLPLCPSSSQQSIIIMNKGLHKSEVVDVPPYVCYLFNAANVEAGRALICALHTEKSDHILSTTYSWQRQQLQKAKRQRDKAKRIQSYIAHNMHDHQKVICARSYNWNIERQQDKVVQKWNLSQQYFFQTFFFFFSLGKM